jgi:hypothetical protein
MGLRLENIFITDDGILKIFDFSNSFKLDQLSEGIWDNI